jgi:hypothetical protein
LHNEMGICTEICQMQEMPRGPTSVLRLVTVNIFQSSYTRLFDN